MPSKASKPKLSLEQIKKLPPEFFSLLIEKARKYLKSDPTMLQAFKDHGVDIKYLDYIPIAFDDLDVSAQTAHGVIYLNYALLCDGDFFKDFGYLVHEICHELQQCWGDKPTQGSDEGNYLDNKSEQEAFQRQVQFLDDKFGPDEAEEYIDDLLDHHEVPKSEKKDKKDVLMSKASKQNELEDLLKQALMGDHDSWIVLLDLIEETHPKLRKLMKNIASTFDVLSEVCPNIIKTKSSESHDFIQVLAPNFGGFEEFKINENLLYIEYKNYTFYKPNHNAKDNGTVVFNHPINLRIFDLPVSKIKYYGDYSFGVETNDGIIHFSDANYADEDEMHFTDPDKLVSETYYKYSGKALLDITNISKIFAMPAKTIQASHKHSDLENMLKQALLGDSESYQVFLDAIEEEFPELKERLVNHQKYNELISTFDELSRWFNDIFHVNGSKCIFKVPTFGKFHMFEGSLRGGSAQLEYSKWNFIWRGNNKHQIRFSSPNIKYDESLVRMLSGPVDNLTVYLVDGRFESSDGKINNIYKEFEQKGEKDLDKLYNIFLPNFFNKNALNRGNMNISEKINKFYKQAQQASAQPGDVETALKSASLWDLTKDVAGLLNVAGVPDSSSVELQIVVSAGPKISFNSVLSPDVPGIGSKLSTLLNKKYGAVMSGALTKAGLNVEEPISVSWLKF